MSLFWRTFLWLVVLMVVCMGTWLGLFWTMEMEPRAYKNAAQISSLINLSRAALIHADPKARLSLINTMDLQESVRIAPREPGDQIKDYHHNPLTNRTHEELKIRLGEDTPMVSSVNGEAGLWIGFTIEGDAYWLYAAPERLADVDIGTWLIGLLIVGILAFGGAALITRRLNQPLSLLAKAAAMVSTGRFQTLALDVHSPTPEIAQVNHAFVHMGEQLAQIERNRGIMLAGLAHDVRTPLTRIRLETELSLMDDDVKRELHADIEQIDQLVGKFLDYAHDGGLQTERMDLLPFVQSVLEPYQKKSDMALDFAANQLSHPAPIWVEADPTELGRCIVNVLENALRYGRSEDGVCRVQVQCAEHKAWGQIPRMALSFCDQGAGVPAHVLPLLTQAFYRADTARTAAKGSGLGLAIVEKNIHRMGGQLSLHAPPSGGLCVQFIFTLPSHGITTQPLH